MRKCVKHTCIGAPSSYIACFPKNAKPVPTIGIQRWNSGVVIDKHGESAFRADIFRKRLLKARNTELSRVEHNQILNLSDDGGRWEGDVLDNKPCGWGVLFDSENRRTYEGFRVGDVNVCYGISFYPDSGVIEYMGELCGGKRWGRGTLYNRKGVEVYCGEWMNNERLERRVMVSGELPFLHNRIEELFVGNGSCNGDEWEVLSLSFMPGLRVFRVGSDCFKQTRMLTICGLKKLEEVTVGHHCFMGDENSKKPSCLTVEDCDAIRALTIGCASFMYYQRCRIQYLESLKKIEMGAMNANSRAFFFTLELVIESGFGE